MKNITAQTFILLMDHVIEKCNSAAITEDRLTVSCDNNTLRAIGKPLAYNDLLFNFNVKEDRLEICCGDDPNRANDKFLFIATSFRKELLQNPARPTTIILQR
uniref:Uncharacterized protein n=1 Tax=Glossina pallidipes TaxID=7398 RepID=A0A1A9ZCD5_GLOPL